MGWSNAAPGHFLLSKTIKQRSGGSFELSKKAPPRTQVLHRTHEQRLAPSLRINRRLSDFSPRLRPRWCGEVILWAVQRRRILKVATVGNHTRLHADERTSAKRESPLQVLSPADANSSIRMNVSLRGCSEETHILASAKISDRDPDRQRQARLLVSPDRSRAFSDARAGCADGPVAAES
jgi:hypothetical protein